MLVGRYRFSLRVDAVHLFSILRSRTKACLLGRRAGLHPARAKIQVQSPEQAFNQSRQKLVELTGRQAPDVVMIASCMWCGSSSICCALKPDVAADRSTEPKQSKTSFRQRGSAVPGSHLKSAR